MHAPRHIEILDAHSHPQRLAWFRELCRAYAAGLPFSLCFQGFEEELAALPGKYAPDAGAGAGCMLLAVVDGEPAGCIALRALAASGYLAGDAKPACEMKRMFVKPSYRGLGLGRALGVAALARAREAGYKLMKLDTETTFVEATALYRSLGFAEVPRYNDDPLEHTMWMAKDLRLS